MLRIIMTLLIALLYSVIWQKLEIAIYKKIEPRIVDDIMMILFLPIIYMALGK